ncbi:hypothetical protein LTR85_003550 [Meristemomyces frigidus]|nr:hypothetical protein LTR85_003550 [Meristemomyces frigidus]
MAWVEGSSNTATSRHQHSGRSTHVPAATDFAPNPSIEEIDLDSLPLAQLRRGISPVNGSGQDRRRHSDIQKCYDERQSILFCLPTELYLNISEHPMDSVRDVLHLHIAVDLVSSRERGWEVEWMKLANRHRDAILDNVALCEKIPMDGLRQERFAPTNITPSYESGLRRDMTYFQIRRAMKGNPNVVSVSKAELEELLAIDQKTHRGYLLSTSRTLRRNRDIPFPDAREDLGLDDYDRRKYLEMLHDPPLDRPSKKELDRHKALPSAERKKELVWLIFPRYKAIASWRKRNEKERLLLNRQDLAFKAAFNRVILHDSTLDTCMQCLRHANMKQVLYQPLSKQLLTKAEAANIGRPKDVFFCEDCQRKWCEDTRVKGSDFAIFRIGWDLVCDQHQTQHCPVTIRYREYASPQKLLTVSRTDTNHIAMRYAGVSWDALQSQHRLWQWSPSQLWKAARRYTICAKAVLRALNWYEGERIDDITCSSRTQDRSVQYLDGLLSVGFAAAFRDHHKLRTDGQAKVDNIFTHIAALYDNEPPWTTEADMEMHDDLRGTLSETWCDFTAADYWYHYIEVHLGRIPHLRLRRDHFIIADRVVEPEVRSYEEPMDMHSCTIAEANALCRKIHGCTLRELDHKATQTKARELRQYQICTAATRHAMNLYEQSVTEGFVDLSMLAHSSADMRYGQSPLPGIGNPTVTTATHPAPLASHIMRMFQHVVHSNPPPENSLRNVFTVSEVPACLTEALSKTLWQDFHMNDTYFDSLGAWVAGKKVWLAVDSCAEQRV